MAVKDFIAFLVNLADIQTGVATFTPDSTDVGFAADNAREMDLVKAWKPTDTAGDHVMNVDGGTTTWMGAAGATAAWGVAYDARGSDQNVIKMQYDSADNPLFTSPVTIAPFANLDKTQVSCDYLQFTIPWPAKRYYRLMMNDVADRGAGNVMPKIYVLPPYARSGYVQLWSDFAADAQGQHDYEQFYRVALDQTCAEVDVTNRYGATGYRFSVSFNPATDAFWSYLWAKMHALDGVRTPILAQLSGIQNPPADGFFAVRLKDTFKGTRLYDTQVTFKMTFETLYWI